MKMKWQHTPTYISLERTLLYHRYPGIRAHIFRRMKIHARKKKKKVFLHSQYSYSWQFFKEYYLLCLLASRFFPTFLLLIPSKTFKRKAKNLFSGFFFSVFPVQRGFAIHFFGVTDTRMLILESKKGGRVEATGMNDVNLYFTAMHRYSFA